MSSICEGIVYDVHPSNTLCVQGVAAEFLTADVQSLGTLVVSSNKRPERPPVEKGAASFWFRTCFDFRAAWPWNARPLLKRWSSLVPSPNGGVNSDCRRTEPTALQPGRGTQKRKGRACAASICREARSKEVVLPAHGPAIIERAILLMPRTFAGNLSSSQLSGL